MLKNFVLTHGPTQLGALIFFGPPVLCGVALAAIAQWEEHQERSMPNSNRAFMAIIIGGPLLYAAVIAITLGVAFPPNELGAMAGFLVLPLGLMYYVVAGITMLVCYGVILATTWVAKRAAQTWRRYSCALA